jgi:probable HAF family extracellular repeat protein
VLGVATTLLVTAGLVGAKGGKPPKPPPEPPGPAYTLIDLGTLGGTFSKAHAINEAGQVVGNSNAADGKTYPFLITPEDTDGDGKPDRWFRDDDADGVNDLMIPLGLLGGGSFGFGGIALDINEQGQVVGWSTINDQTNNEPMHACLWAEEQMIDLGVFEVGKGSMVAAINTHGLIVGRSASTGIDSGFLIVPQDTNGDGAPDVWVADENGDGVNDLMTTLVTSQFEAKDINDAGQVLGSKGYPVNRGLLLTPEDTNGDGTPDLWWRDENGDGLSDLFVELPPLDGGNTTVAEGLNASGQVAGTSAAKAGKWTLWHAVRWSSDSEPLPTDLGAPGNKWGSSGGAAINDQGDVVGDGEGEAMLWTDGKMYVLFDLLTNPDGVGTIDKAHDINNAGQIVGFTTNGDVIEAFIAVPADG